MQFAVTFRHMEATDALKAYAEKRIERRLKKYFPDPIAVSIVMSTERHNHHCDVNVQLHNGLTLAGHETTENMYSSIDLVVAKLERQVRRYKDKLRDHKVKSRFEPLPWSHKVISQPGAEPRPGDGQAAAPEPKTNGHATVTHKDEKFHANPMSVDDAIMTLNLEHKQFLVYRCAATGAVNVIYRRDNGSYGLIETPPPA